MKIIAYDNFKPGVSLDDLRPYLRDEVSNVWRLWKAGIVRENYARADVDGVVIVLSARHWRTPSHVADFPLTKAALSNGSSSRSTPLPLEFVRPSVDVKSHGRTPRASSAHEG